MSKPDGLEERIAKLIERGKAIVDGDPPEAAGGDKSLVNFALPVVRREFPRHPWTEPLRHNIDYQPSPRKSLLVPPHQCAVCGGGIWERGEHEKDPEACRQEKVRQIMES